MASSKGTARARAFAAVRTGGVRRAAGADRRRPGVLRTLLIASLVAIVVVVTFVLTAPATLADWALAKATHGIVRLADASGSIWNGSGRLVLVDLVTERARDERAASERGPAALAGVVIPGTVRWQVSPWPLLLGRLQARASHESMGTPVPIGGTLRRLDIGAGSLQLPSIDFGRLGSPWSTVKPTGSLAANWQPLVIENNQFKGKATLELRDIASSLTPVRPLGAYRIHVDASGATTQVRIETLQGPLRLSGGGAFTPRTGLRATVAAEAEPAERLRLQSLLGLLGRRDGTRTIIKIGA
ncbi:MAG: type II secretion system protein N [Lautropia sp.]